MKRVFLISLLILFSIGLGYLSTYLITQTSAQIATTRFITPPGAGVNIDWRDIQGDVRITAGSLGVGLGAGVNPAYRIDLNGDIRAKNGWLRTTGATGWQGDYDNNGTYDGGWYMSDSNTIRAYGATNTVVTGGEVQSATARATTICLNGDCRTVWPTSAPVSQCKPTGGYSGNCTSGFAALYETPRRTGSFPGSCNADSEAYHDLLGGPSDDSSDKWCKELGFAGGNCASYEGHTAPVWFVNDGNWKCDYPGGNDGRCNRAVCFN